MSTTVGKGSGEADDKTEINELIKQINLTILNLQRKRLHLSRELSIAFKQKVPKIEEIGDGENEDATGGQYSDEKIDRLKNLIDQFDLKIKEAQTTKDNLTQLGKLQSVNNIDQKEKLNEEGLPFMDIQEEVDEDGNIISSKINNAPVKIEKQTEKAPKVKKSSPEKTKDKDQNDELMQLFSDMELMPDKNRLKHHLNQDELLNKIDELKINPEEKFDLKKICVQAFNDYNEDDEERGEEVPDSEREATPGVAGGGDKGRGNIDTDNLLELELLADEFDNEEDEDNKYADNEDWDYDFEEEDDDDDVDDDDDDDRADALLYGTEPNATWLGGKLGDEKSTSLFWNQIAELREQEKMTKNSHKHGLDVSELEKAAVEAADGKKKQKSVRFANNLDIKKVENISDSLKNPEPFKKSSLFKQNRRNVYSNGNSDASISSTDNIVEDTIVERDVDDHPNEAIVEDTIMERDADSLSSPESSKPHTSATSDILERKPKPASKFKASRNKLSFNEAGTVETLAQSESDVSSSRSSGHALEKDINSSKSTKATDTQFDYNNVQDMDTMAKAYSMGMYDDDIDIDGPLVEELKDFEALNKIIESNGRDGIKSETPIGEVYDKKSNEVGMDFEESKDIDEDDENDAMINDIEEHDIEEDDSNLDLNENEITNQELSESYYKMREKMLARQSAKHEEQGFEPTDEEGNPVRVSRFKARMNR
ncbi:hypothetical protein CANMA_000602 [Candida margitis]|uniref:uncharacterized protein n=1 Tax=Candida margitis TaxID=1775924 RepID=UPI0022278288|nr:uncharacterized protein CANMA_000602 [Candida margitis]KAI5970345.1 hypothetical protein CANMA_000602 [Candida margitis]